MNFILSRLLAYAWPIAAAAGIALVAALGWQTVQRANAERGLAQEQRARAQDRAESESVARITSETYRREEQRRNQATQEAINAAEEQAARVRADLALADAAAGRLRQRVAALVAAARQAASNPSPAEGGPPATDADMVLADLLGRCGTRIRQLADLADQRGLAGSACERIHDELTPAEAVTP